MSLLDDVSIVVTPNGYKAGELYAVVPVPTEGAEEITNGDFATDTDWTKGTGWTISGGTANCNNTSGSTQDLKTENRILNLGGKTVKIEFTVSNYSGSATMIVTLQGTGGNDFTGINANGTYTAYASVQLSENSIDLLFKASNGWIGSIDNVSVKEYTAADMDVTRATAGTRVDEDGLVNYAEVIGDELVTNGDFATDSDWSVTQSGNDTITIENGYALFNCPDNSNIYISQGGLLTIGKTYIASVDLLSIDSGSLQFAQGGGGTITGSPSINTLGTHTFTFIAATATFAVKRKLGAPNLLNAKIDNVSVKEVTRDNVPRIDYTGGGCPHILAEPQRTNLIPYSEAFNSWNTIQFVTVAEDTSETTSPSGNNTASKITINSASTVRRLFEVISTSSGSDYTFTLYAKKGTTDFIRVYFSSSIIDISFDLTNGTKTVSSGTGSIESVGNDWYRIQGTGTSSLTTEVPQIQLSNSASVNDYLYIWGAQTEEGSYATSYIPNFGTALGVTRNQDIFTRDGIGSLINDSEGTLYFEGSTLENGGSSHRIISLSDGTSNNLIYIRIDDTVSRFRGFARGSSGSYTLITVNGIPQTDNNKIALVWDATNFAIWINGSKRATTTINNLPVGINVLNLADTGGTSDPFFGKVKQLQVYKTALTDAQLTSLTS